MGLPVKPRATKGDQTNWAGSLLKKGEAMGCWVIGKMAGWKVGVGDPVSGPKSVKKHLNAKICRLSVAERTLKGIESGLTSTLSELKPGVALLTDPAAPWNLRQARVVNDKFADKFVLD